MIILANVIAKCAFFDRRAGLIACEKKWVEIFEGERLACVGGEVPSGSVYIFALSHPVVEIPSMT